MIRMLVRVMALLLAFAPLFAGNPRADERSPAPKGAKVFFLDLKDGQTIPAKTTIHFGISGMDLAAAGSSRPNTGHHHLLIDTELPRLDQPIPADFNHIHFGRGQDEVELSLTPGAHTLRLLLSDGNHVPHDPPVVSPVIHVFVDPATVQKQKTRSPSPSGAKVLFIGLSDGAKPPLKSTIQFGISGMDIAPLAGTQKPNTGHHHLLIDAPLPALDREIPSDLNHVHFGRGQTSAEGTLTPGEHTLQLLLSDHEHVPHDPRVISDVVHVYVSDTAAGAPQTASSTGRQSSPPTLLFTSSTRMTGSGSKQTFLGCPTNVCLESFVFAEFFPKTGKATFGNSA